MFLPFSKRAKPWEPIAIQLRRNIGVGRYGFLDPWELAPKAGLRLFADIASLEGLSQQDKNLLLRGERYSWSAGVYPEPLPDGTFLCILNPRHSKHRQKISLMEEIAHQYLDHKPSRITLSKDGLCIRDFSKKHEEEAYGVGAAALLPWHMFFPRVNKGENFRDLSEYFNVTAALIEYRIKITGLMPTYKVRQRKKVEDE